MKMARFMTHLGKHLSGWCGVGVAALCATLLYVNAAHAQQKFPTKPIRIVVAFTAGGTPDTLARIIGQKMSENWGQPVIIENRPGASGTLAAHLVARATPDGYTLLATSASIAINVAMQAKLPYDTLKDIAGVANIGYSTDALVVAPALGIKTMRELITHGRANPGKLMFGSSGTGTSVHLAGEKFVAESGFKALHVPFKGLPEALIDIAAGRIHFGVAVLGASRPFIREGKLVLLAVGPDRSPLYPDVPAIAEMLPGYTRAGTQALFAPRATPRAVLLHLSREIGRVLELKDVRERLQDMGFYVAHTLPDETDRLLREDIQAFTKQVRALGLQAN
jgi:tripartite-type tricarboxylate transporter receptor subunit TctC